jgi:methylenetetrahydrofolate dehydrogenase (NADP+) / methenyltetrahydrofolate cyclohydrolase
LPPILLDGRPLAARRAPEIVRQAATVLQQRGRAPGLLLVAFPDASGRVPHVAGKLRACAAAGIDAFPLFADPDLPTAAVLDAIATAIDAHDPDAVFVQLPIPTGLDADAIMESIPLSSDVDVMTRAGYAAYMDDLHRQPPVTISAALMLLDEYDIQIAGRRGIVLADASPFAEMFREALHRRGAHMLPVKEPTARDRDQAVAGADTIVVAAGSAGILPSSTLPAGSVALDIGYFNEGGRGDIDVSHGIARLAALMPVPGGVGPMTVSALLERVVVSAQPDGGRTPHR